MNGVILGRLFQGMAKEGRIADTAFGVRVHGRLGQEQIHLRWRASLREFNGIHNPFNGRRDLDCEKCGCT